jgi:hypothetical protein
MTNLDSMANTNAFNNAFATTREDAIAENTSSIREQRLSIKEQVSKLGETFGEFKAYDSQLPLGNIEGTRIVKCLYQVNTKTGEKKRESSYTRISTAHLTDAIVKDNIVALAPFIVGYLESLEDKIIKGEHEKGALSFFTEKLSIDYIINYLEENADSGRLSKELVGKWFENNLERNLILVVADKLGIEVENMSEANQVKIQRVVNAYRTKFESLASPKVIIKEADCTAMINVINTYDENSSALGARFIQKLNSMNTKVEEVLFAL